MVQADGFLTQADDNYNINYLAQADWSLSLLQPMSLLLTHLNDWLLHSLKQFAARFRVPFKTLHLPQLHLYRSAMGY